MILIPLFAEIVCIKNRFKKCGKKFEPAQNNLCLPLVAVRLINEALSCGGRTFVHAPSIKAVVIKCWLRPSSSRYSVEQSVLWSWAPSSVLLHLLLCPVCNKNKGVLHFSLLFLPRCCNTCECCSVDFFFPRADEVCSRVC